MIVSCLRKKQTNKMLYVAALQKHSMINVITQEEVSLQSGTDAGAPNMSSQQIEDVFWMVIQD